MRSDPVARLEGGRRPFIGLLAFALAAATVSVLPASAADAEWSLHGRPLPEPEFLQPRLDPDLPPAPPVAGQRGRVEGSAPSILPGLVSRWIEAFGHDRPDARVEVPPPYDPPQGASSARLTMFLQGKLPFAFLTRDLGGPDRAAFRRWHGYDPIVVPVAGGSFRQFGFVDAVAVIVNRDNPVDRLSLAQLDAIFSQTRLRGAITPTDWSDLGGHAGHPIHVVGGASFLGEESARAAAFRRAVMDRGGIAGHWRHDVPARREADVALDVASDPDAIGFTGLGHLDEKVKPLALQIEAGGAFLPATYEAIAKAVYPLARTVTIAVDRPPGKPLDPVLRAFVAFCVSGPGQRIVSEQGVFLPLRAWQSRAAMEALGPS